MLRSEAEAKQQASDALTKDQAEAVALTSRNSRYTVELQFNYTLQCSCIFLSAVYNFICAGIKAVQGRH